MRLTLKIVVAFMLTAVALATINTWRGLSLEDLEFQEDTHLDAERLGTAVEGLLMVAWKNGGSAEVLEIIRQASGEQQRMSIRWVWLDAAENDPYRPGLSPEVFQLASLKQHHATEFWEPRDRRVLYAYWPMLMEDEGRLGALEMIKKTDELRKHRVDLIFRQIARTATLLVVAALITSLLGVRVVGRPLKQLVEKTQRVAAGDLSDPLDLNTHDELGQLASAFNEMCSRLEQSQQRLRAETEARVQAMTHLRHADRLRTVGRLASGVAHELGTPLNVVSGRAGLIASGKLSHDEIADSAKTIKSETEKMTSIIGQLLEFARRGTPQRAEVDLRQVVGQTLDVLSALADKRQCKLTLVGGDQPCVAPVATRQIQQVLTNLIVNAMHAMPEGGAVEVGVHPQHARPPEGHDAAEGDYYCIYVRDQGEGMSPETLERVFEPFFTTKDVGEGTGLGLAIAYNIVQEHGGWIDVASMPGEGSCFSVFLPRESNQ